MALRGNAEEIVRETYRDAIVDEGDGNTDYVYIRVSFTNQRSLGYGSDKNLAWESASNNVKREQKELVAQ